jgi:hypothetical protein
LNQFLKYGLTYVFLSLVYLLGLYLGWLYGFITLLLILILILDLNLNSSVNTEKLTIVESEELVSFLRNLGDKDGKIAMSSTESGAVIHRIRSENVYIIPKHTNPELATDEAKAVISHEYSHIKNNDKIISTLIDILLISLQGFLILIPPIIALIVFILNCLILFPIIKNYLNHQFEYRADSFAVQKSDLRAVQRRLRRNSHLTPKSSKYIPYNTTHPSIQSRMDKIYDEKDSFEL